MKRALPMLVMMIGLGMAAAFGARNGESQIAYRHAGWTVSHPEAVEGGEPRRPAKSVLRKGAPAPKVRISEWFSVGGIGWGFGILLILGGALAARRQLAEEMSGGEGSSGLADFPGTLAEIRARIEPLGAELADLAMDETAPAAREALDALRMELIEPLVDARGQMIARHGIAAFAEYFGPFSSGERQLNRVWSALTDGHPPTAREALADAQQSFGLAAEAWARAEEALPA